MTRRPIQKRVLTFLAESEKGLDQLIRQQTHHERVLSVTKYMTNEYDMLAKCRAKVTVLA